MSLVVIAVVLVMIFFAFKAVGMVLRLALWAVILYGIYWLVAPHIGGGRPW